MPNHLSVLGILQTAISIAALLVALYALLRSGKVNPAKPIGKIYMVLTAITFLTSLLVINPGQSSGTHALAIAVLVMLPLAYYVRFIHLLGTTARYIETVLISATVFFSMIPVIVETLTRLPVGAPIAMGPSDPIIKSSLIVLTIAFVGGLTYQLRKIYSDLQVPVSG